MRAAEDTGGSSLFMKEKLSNIFWPITAIVIFVLWLVGYTLIYFYLKVKGKIEDITL
jgi:hypothetical protein